MLKRLSHAFDRPHTNAICQTGGAEVGMSEQGGTTHIFDLSEIQGKNGEKEYVHERREQASVFIFLPLFILGAQRS